MDVMARLDDVENDLKTEKREHKEDVDLLNKKIDFLTQENQLLKDDNARLKSIINNDSSNTSLPPSTDQKGGKASNTYNGRTKTKRKAGGQKGHKGQTLTKSNVKKKLESGEFRHDIRNIRDPSGAKYITRYTIDLDVVPVITEIRIYADEKGKFSIPSEYRSGVTYGENLKSMTVALYSEGVMSNDRIAAFLNAISGDRLELSEGSIYGFCRKFAKESEAIVESLEKELLNQNVVATDATVTTINGKQSYIRNFSIHDTVVYRAMKSKAIDALKKLDFLKRYTGILVHDHETALYHFGTDHAECNVHLIRYLRKNSEDTGNKWSDQMIKLLCEMNRSRKALIENGETSFSEKVIEEYEKQYHDLIKEGRKQNKKTSSAYAKQDENKLLNRMEKYSRNHLLFLHDFEVMFDDNLSERDLRKVKNRQKMAGGFRKDSGQEMYCTIMTIIETLKRRKMGLLENIKKIFMGTPAIF